MASTIHVAHIPDLATVEDLLDFFGRYGDIITIKDGRFVYDNSRSIKITYNDYRDADDALSLDGHSWDGFAIQVMSNPDRHPVVDERVIYQDENIPPPPERQVPSPPQSPAPSSSPQPRDIQHEPSFNDLVLETYLKQVYGLPVITPPLLNVNNVLMAFIPFYGASEFIQRGFISRFELLPQLQVWAGPPNSPNRIITLHATNGLTYLVKSRYDPNTQQMYPPI